MGIFNRLFGKKKDSKKNLTIKKPKSKPTENYKIVLIEIKFRGGNVSKSEFKRFINKTVFETFMSINSHHFNTPTNNHYQYLSKGGCIKLSYSNSSPDRTPPFTIGISIYNNDTQDWVGFGPRNYITGNFRVNSTDKKLFTEIEKIKSLHSRVSKINPDIHNKKIEEDKKRLEQEERKKLEKEKQNFDTKKNKILQDLDKDGNGIIDIIEGDDFMSLFRKHQSIIKEFDKQYINYLVKISNYLKIKKNNIQNIFSEISKTNNQSKLIENVGLLKNQIHTYEVILFHSLNLITSIVEDDLITVNEIYEEFDKLKIFKSDHEKEVSQQLSEIGDGLNNLMYSINSMERNIVSGLNNLSYVTQDGFSDLNNSLTRELESIGSSIETNNLLTGIQTYQMYKINKNTKSLN